MSKRYSKIQLFRCCNVSRRQAHYTLAEVLAKGETLVVLEASIYLVYIFTSSTLSSDDQACRCPGHKLLGPIRSVQDMEREFFSGIRVIKSDFYTLLSGNEQHHPANGSSPQPTSGANDYNLVDPDGNVILPLLWDAVVQDGLIIKMSPKQPVVVPPGM
jgi:hypothetical protein